MAGQVTISLEVELGWGFHDLAPPSDIPELSDDGKAERAALERLLELCDEFEIPISFDVVGHLLLNTCSGNHKGPHPEGWFDADPGTNVDRDPLFYAPDLIEAIRESNVDHEICTHTFSHILCAEVSRDVVDWELSKVEEVHPESLTSMVPPRHSDPPRDVIEDHGISVIRMPFDEARPSNPIREYLWTLLRNHPVGDPVDIEGITETRSSSLMTLTATYLSRGVANPHLAYRVLPRRMRQAHHEQFLLSGLKRAVRDDTSIHYWSHLYNLANESQWPPIETFIKTLANHHKANEISIVPMRGLNSWP
ncbi:polysaccharide deacetylase [Natronomonas gomsonensis]|uniref:polysaccharide deacetylase n=1 Tax=Natronomonas gomsonensis TaxID=1046043 RepID=UPI0015BCF740|nr:polysaccharide deacetylase [Natronomonas gomsonensis]